MANKKNKNKGAYSGMPYNKDTDIHRAKKATNINTAEPTVDTFSNIQSSDDIVRLSNDNSSQDQIRPSKNSFNISDYSKEIWVTILIGIGSYLIYNKIEVSLLSKDIITNKENIKTTKEDQKKSETEINELKNKTYLINYRIDKLEKKPEK